MKIPQYLLEISLDYLPEIKFDSDSVSDKKKKQKIIRKRMAFLHNLSKNSLIRWLEYEHKIDRHLYRTLNCFNRFLDSLYKYVLKKYDDEKIFTMYANWIVDVVEKKNLKNENNLSYGKNKSSSINGKNIIEITEIPNNIEEYSDKYISKEIYNQNSTDFKRKFLNFNPEISLTDFLGVFTRRNKSLYKYLLLSKKLYQLGKINISREHMLDAIRYAKNRKDYPAIKNILELFKEYEIKHGDGKLDGLIAQEIQNNINH